MEQDRHGKGYEIVEHKSEYRVDGEVGRFKFGLFNVVGPDGIQIFKGAGYWPFRQGKQWYQTCGFKELAFLSGVTQSSYRKMTHNLNRWRRQENEEGTPVTTLQDAAEVEGSKVIGFLEKQKDHILKAHQFNEDGTPKSTCIETNQAIDHKPIFIDEKHVIGALASVEQAMRKQGLSESEITKVKDNVRATDYEKPEDTVNISVDDVGVKKQKEQRRDCGTEKQETTGKSGQSASTNKRPTVQNTVAQIVYGEKRFTLTGSGVLQVLRFVLAFLLHNNLISLQLKFFTDGQRSLQNAIVDFFSWHPSVSLTLDWYHLAKRFKGDLSSACRLRHARNAHLRHLLRLLWFGLVDQAQNYLRCIPDSNLKDPKAVARLVEYLERNRKWIPCYAVRKKLKLTNSSNAVERANNLVTSQRQKHNGMSWSKTGSHALTALSAVVLNGGIREWVKNKEANLEFAKAA